jgi:hypothetical protein
MTEKWYRYNDYQVSEETEENVFKESIGGYGNSSAYCIVYIDKSKIFAKDSPILPKAGKKQTSSYENFLPGHLRKDVMNENNTFNEEVVNYKMTQLCR